MIKVLKRKTRSLFRHIRYIPARLRLIDLQETQWWTKEQLSEYQLFRLKKIVKYAYENIPGYRKKYDKIGIRPDHIKTLEDLSKFPIVTRQELQDNEDFINRKYISATLFTGGSTGESLRYYESYQSGLIRKASWNRGWSWAGYHPGDRLAVIQSAQLQIKKKKLLNLVGDMQEKNMVENAKRLLDFKPVFVSGYVSSVYLMAKHLLNNNIFLAGVKAVSVTSENLYDYQRNVIKTAFSAPIFEEYGCNDGGASAWDCGKEEGLHHSAERSIIEDVGGKMITTDLWNLAMPFIRYDNGDGVEFLPGRCSCGRELPLIKVKCRQNDILIGRDGPISPNYLVHHGIGCRGIGLSNNFCSGISAIQYVQEPGYLLNVYVVKNSHCSDSEYAIFKKNVFKIIKGLKVNFIAVSEIPATPKGKRAFVINNDLKLLNKLKTKDK